MYVWVVSLSIGVLCQLLLFTASQAMCVHTPAIDWGLQSQQSVCTCLVCVVFHPSRPIGSVRFSSYVVAHFGGRVCSRTFLKTGRFCELRIVLGGCPYQMLPMKAQTPQKLPPPPPKPTNHDGWGSWGDSWWMAGSYSWWWWLSCVWPRHVVRAPMYTHLGGQAFSRATPKQSTAQYILTGSRHSTSQNRK
jgi:hypothetical protein